MNELEVAVKRWLNTAIENRPKQQQKRSPEYHPIYGSDGRVYRQNVEDNKHEITEGSELDKVVNDYYEHKKEKESRLSVRYDPFSAIPIIRDFSPISRGYKMDPKKSIAENEADARRQGYKTMEKRYISTPTTELYIKYTVNYPSTAKSKKEKAQEQLDKYGITEEQADDKSNFSNTWYQYAPSYGYDVVSAADNYILNNKTHDIDTQKENKKYKYKSGPVDAFIQGGRRIIESGSDLTQKVSKRYNMLQPVATTLKQASDKLRQLNDSRNFGTSPMREDKRNLLASRPQQNNTLKISDYDTLGKGKLRDGYAYTERNPHYMDDVYNLAKGYKRKSFVGKDRNNFSISYNDKDKYYSDYDLWDVNPLSYVLDPIYSKFGTTAPSIGKSFELYNRRYINIPGTKTDNSNASYLSGDDNDQFSRGGKLYNLKFL